MFINFHNQQKYTQKKYTKESVKSVLESLETKNKAKIDKLTEGLEDIVVLEDVLNLFSDKLKAIKSFALFEEAKPGPDPYMRDLDDEEKEDKEEQMKDQTELDDDDPDAYKEMPGDEEAREKGEVKTSKHTKAYDELYGDDEVDEARDMNDPVLIAFRAAQQRRQELGAQPVRRSLTGKSREKAEDKLWKISQELKDLYSERGDLYNDMENEAGSMGADEFEAQGLHNEYGDKLNKVEAKIAKLLAQRSTLEVRLAESFEVNEAVDTETVIQIELEDGIYYIKPYGDSTHFYMSTMKDSIENAIPAHIGQHRSRPYYSDLRKYLKGGKDIDGNSYIGESYLNEGKDDYMAKYGKTDIMIKKGYKVADEGALEDLYVKLGELASELGFGVKNITVVTEGKLTWQKVMEHIESIEEDEQIDEMTYGQLERCVDYAKMIRDRFDEGYSFDSWMHSKVNCAKKDLNAVFDALDGGDGEIEEVQEGMNKTAIKKQIKIIDQQINDEEGGDGEPLTDETLAELEKERERLQKMLESNVQVNEDLKNDVKKYIKKNKKDLDDMADADQWDQIYTQIYTDFDVEPESEDAQELKTVFNVTY